MNQLTSRNRKANTNNRFTTSTRNWRNPTLSTCAPVNVIASCPRVPIIKHTTLMSKNFPTRCRGELYARESSNMTALSMMLRSERISPPSSAIVEKREPTLIFETSFVYMLLIYRSYLAKFRDSSFSKISSSLKSDLQPYAAKTAASRRFMSHQRAQIDKMLLHRLALACISTFPFTDEVLRG